MADGYKTYVPFLIQHEEGIVFIPKSTNRKITIKRKTPYTPATQEDQDQIEAIIKNDAHCGIVELGKQQMPKQERSLNEALMDERRKTAGLEAELERLKGEQAAAAKGNKG